MFKYFIAILISITLASCMDQNCIEADDFGLPSVTIPVYSNYNSIQGQAAAQYVPWIDSGYILNGYPLLIVVSNWSKGDDNTAEALSAWCPWYGSSAYGSTLAPICQEFSSCIFTAKGEVPNYLVQNPPCVMNKGKGLYAALVNSNYDINSTSSSIKAPDPTQAFTVHLGEDLNTPLSEIDNNGNMQPAGGIWLNGTSDFIPKQPPNVNTELIKSSFISYQSVNNNPTIDKIAGTKLYFKILDTYYGDNSGQYQVTIKSGVALPSTDVFSTVVSLVKSILFGSVSNNNGEGVASILVSNNSLDVSSNGIIFGIFNNITNNSSFKNAVIRILTIYIIFTVIFYLLGFTNFSLHELLTVISKIAVISALLSPHSWAFFYNYLFIFFINGSEEIINLIKISGSTGPGSDSIVALMVAPETLIKLVSLLAIDGKAWVYMVLYFLLLLYLLYVLASATLLFLNALIIVGIVISVGPIFLCFMLFSKTSSLYRNWLNQLFAYSIQPVILFTGITFMSVLIRHEIYTTLGFKVCKNYFWQIGGQNTSWYWWLPSPYKAGSFANTAVPLYVPEDHWQTTPAANQTTNLCTPNPDYISHGIIPPAVNNAKYCKAYECVEPRLVDLPFLDLNVSYDCQKAKDFVSGNFIQLSPLILFVILIFLLDKFNAMAVEISQFLSKDFAGGSGVMNLSAAGGWLNQFAKSIVQTIGEKTYVNKAANMINKTILGIIRRPFKLVLSSDVYKSGAKFIIKKSLTLPLQIFKLRKLWMKRVASISKLADVIKLQKDYKSLLSKQAALKLMQKNDPRMKKLQNEINFLAVKLQPYKAMLEKLESKNIKLEQLNVNAKQQLKNTLTASLNRLTANLFTSKLDRDQIKSATRDLMKVNKLSTRELKNKLVEEVYGKPLVAQLLVRRQRVYESLSDKQKKQIDVLYTQRYGEKIEDRTKYQLAQILYKQSFDDLTDKRKEKINEATNQKGSLSIAKLSEDYRQLSKYQELYIKNSSIRRKVVKSTVKLEEVTKNALTASLNSLNSDRNILFRFKQGQVESYVSDLIRVNNLSKGQLKQEIVDRDHARKWNLLGRKSEQAPRYIDLPGDSQQILDIKYKQRYGEKIEDRTKYQLAQILYKKSFDDLTDKRKEGIDKALVQTGLLKLEDISPKAPAATIIDMLFRFFSRLLGRDGAAGAASQQDKAPGAPIDAQKKAIRPQEKPATRTDMLSRVVAGILGGGVRGSIDGNAKGALSNLASTDQQAKPVITSGDVQKEATQPQEKPTTKPQEKSATRTDMFSRSSAAGSLAGDARGSIDGAAKGILGESIANEQTSKVLTPVKDLTVKSTTSQETKLPDSQDRRIIQEKVSSDARSALTEDEKSKVGGSSFDNQPKVSDQLSRDRLASLDEDKRFSFDNQPKVSDQLSRDPLASLDADKRSSFDNQPLQPLQTLDQFSKDAQAQRKAFIEQEKEKAVGGLGGDFAGGISASPEGPIGQSIEGGLGDVKGVLDFDVPNKDEDKSQNPLEEAIKQREILAAEIEKADEKAEAIAKAKDMISGDHGDVSSDSAKDARPSRPINTNKKPPE